MLIRFLAKRTAVVSAVLAAAALFAGHLGALFSPGLLLGAFLGVYRVRLSSLSLAKAVGGAGGAALVQLFSQGLSLAVLLAGALADTALFTGVAAGLLMPPLLICVNAFTERACITHNNWGEPAGETRR